MAMRQEFGNGPRSCRRSGAGSRAGRLDPRVGKLSDAAMNRPPKGRSNGRREPSDGRRATGSGGLPRREAHRVAHRWRRSRTDELDPHHTRVPPDLPRPGSGVGHPSAPAGSPSASSTARTATLTARPLMAAARATPELGARPVASSTAGDPTAPRRTQAPHHPSRRRSSRTPSAC